MPLLYTSSPEENTIHAIQLFYQGKTVGTKMRKRILNPSSPICRHSPQPLHSERLPAHRATGSSISLPAKQMSGYAKKSRLLGPFHDIGDEPGGARGKGNVSVGVCSLLPDSTQWKAVIYLSTRKVTLPVLPLQAPLAPHNTEKRPGAAPADTSGFIIKAVSAQVTQLERASASFVSLVQPVAHTLPGQPHFQTLIQLQDLQGRFYLMAGDSCQQNLEFAKCHKNTFISSYDLVRSHEFPLQSNA